MNNGQKSTILRIIQACILFDAKLVIIIFYISQTVEAATMTLLFYFFSPKNTQTVFTDATVASDHNHC